MQRFSFPQGENRVGPAIEQMGSEVIVRPPREPWVVTTELQSVPERFIKRNPLVFEGAINPAMAVRTWTEGPGEFNFKY